MWNSLANTMGLRRYDAMRYAIWNNKGGVGKTFLSFVLSTEYANSHPESQVIVADMCPQANLSEIVLGDSENGSDRLENLISEKRTIGSYFDSRVGSPHAPTTRETDFLVHARDFNENVPNNLWLIAGDPALEIQAQVINQISVQALPSDAWKNVHLWLKDLLDACAAKLGQHSKFFIDCNPSFSATQS
jgi:cellulose biosynthesis protein BcsQ